MPSGGKGLRGAEREDARRAGGGGPSHVAEMACIGSLHASASPAAVHRPRFTAAAAAGPHGAVFVASHSSCGVYALPSLPSPSLLLGSFLPFLLLFFFILPPPLSPFHPQPRLL